MLIYKYKKLLEENEINHFCDIILNERIWAAHPNTLNDKDYEFRHEIDCKLTDETRNLLSQIFIKKKKLNSIIRNLPCELLNNSLQKHGKKTFDDMIENIRNDFGIASFSLFHHDEEKLWRDYGGNGIGACIELEIPSRIFTEMEFFVVNYVEKKIIHIDEFLKTELNDEYSREFIEKILATKHQSWSPEKEVRLIKNQADSFISLSNVKIKKITLGNKISNQTSTQIESKISRRCKEKNIKLKNYV